MDKLPSLVPSDATFVAFDVETTGLWPAAARMVEMAAVRFRLGSDDVEPFAELIDPGSPIPREVTRIHGITDDMVRGHARASEVLARWLGFVGRDSVLVAHNAGFDAGFIAVELSRSRLGEMPNLVLDTLALSWKLLPGLPNHKLESVAHALGVPGPQEHRALGDAMMVHDVLRGLVDRHHDLRDGQRLCRAAQAKHIFDYDVSIAEMPRGWEDMDRAMREGLKVHMVYDGPHGRTTRAIAPLALTCIRDRLYLSAFCHLRGDERTFRLDRIASFQIEE